MATSTSDNTMSFWINFFKEAGIPAGDAANYAVVFTDNRMTRSMLMDLTKEYLKDMGISILGDIISILKHAKTVFNQDARDRALRDTRVSTPTQDPSIIRKSTPASRTIGHYIGSDRSASPSVTQMPKISKELSARLGSPTSGSSPVLGMRSSSPVLKTIQKVTLTPKMPKEEVPVPKNRRVFPEHEGKYKISMPTGTTEKTRKIMEQQRQRAEQQRIKAEEAKKKQSQGTPSVFLRLGSEKKSKSVVSSTEPTITVTGLGHVNMPSSTQASVFHRLGGKTTVKRAATSTVLFDDEEEEEEDLISEQELEYAGVLKHSPKKSKIEVANKLKKNAQKTLAKANVSPGDTAGILAGPAESKGVKSRLGPKVSEVSSTTQSKAGEGVQKGKNKYEAITIRVDRGTKSPGSSVAGSSGVFSRLGKPKS